MYEHRDDGLLTVAEFVGRIGFHGCIAAGVTTAALGIGIFGYHWLGGLSWVDSFVNASMILGGMGPVDALKTSAAKIFAGFYALFSGLVFIGVSGVVMAPFVHRLLHRFHVEDQGGSND
jgi:hypothetical protein